MTPEPIFLSPGEVAVLTGFRLASRQVKWLASKGWRFELNGNRQPIVARRYVEKMLGCGGEEEPALYHPHFDKLRGA
jgi:hypothetical protein